MRRLLVLGLDAAAPELVFERFLDRLPNLGALMSEGVYGRLRSCDPPITIPAWMVMMTGRDAGRLGLYGFRKRRPRTYNEIQLPTSRSVSEPKVWDILGERGFRSCVIGVPPTYPPQPINGCLISCLMTPSAEKDFTHPPQLKERIKSWIGEYVFDVPFRREERDQVLREVYEMTEKRFKVARNLLREEKWSLFILMEIGLDRIQHAFWKYFDPKHHLYKPRNKYQNVIRDYYRFLDEKIGELLGELGDDVDVLVVSDHGAKRMKGAFCVNQWLIEEGFMKLRTPPREITPIEEAEIDWSSTIAWGWGGYYGRIFINLEGREPNGVVKRYEYERVREDLAEALKNVKGPGGEKWKTKVYRPEDLYPIVRGDAPDLIVYFDDLYWRSAGTLGHPTNYLPENDRGPDDAVHDYNGIYILKSENVRPGRRDADILDITPTILDIFEIKHQGSFAGKSIIH